MLNLWFNKKNTKLANGIYLHAKLNIDLVLEIYSTMLSPKEIATLFSITSPLTFEYYILLKAIFLQRAAENRSPVYKELLKNLPEQAKKRLHKIFCFQYHINDIVSLYGLANTRYLFFKYRQAQKNNIEVNQEFIEIVQNNGLYDILHLMSLKPSKDVYLTSKCFKLAIEEREYWFFRFLNKRQKILPPENAIQFFLESIKNIVDKDCPVGAFFQPLNDWWCFADREKYGLSEGIALLTCFFYQMLSIGLFMASSHYHERKKFSLESPIFLSFIASLILPNFLCIVTACCVLFKEVSEGSKEERYLFMLFLSFFTLFTYPVLIFLTAWPVIHCLQKAIFHCQGEPLTFATRQTIIEAANFLCQHKLQLTEEEVNNYEPEFSAKALVILRGHPIWKQGNSNQVNDIENRVNPLHEQRI